MFLKTSASVSSIYLKIVFYFLIFPTCQSAEMLPAPITNGEERASKEILVFTATLPRKYSYGFISH